MNIGDEFLVTSQNFFEKAHIIEKKKFRDKKVYLLSNNIMIDRRGNPVNSKFNVEPFSESREKYFRILHNLPKRLKRLESFNLNKLSELDEATILKINKKVVSIFDLIESI